jgi:hypothetical protein
VKCLACPYTETLSVSLRNTESVSKNAGKSEKNALWLSPFTLIAVLKPSTV